MTLIPIYDIKGIQVDQLEIDDNVTYLHGRISKGDRYYYKGAGVPYSGHYVENVNPETDVFISRSDVFYLGSLVRRPAFEGKQGIFQTTYQPMFSDYIGACSTRELAMIEHSEMFKRTSAEIIKSYRFDVEHSQYYFKVDYKCGRVNYLTGGQPQELVDLLEYMITNDWNFNWDKDSISDVSAGGFVTDISDLYFSRDLNSKLGTVYSILHSLSKGNVKKYIDFLDYANLVHINNMSLIYNVLHLLTRFGIDVEPLYINDNPTEVYKHIVLNHLIVGRNCGDCDLKDYGSNVRDQYQINVRKSFAINNYLIGRA